MAATTNVQVIIDAKDNASKVLKGFGDTASKVTKNYSADLKAAGVMAGSLLVSLTALATGAVKVASSFEQNRIAFETMLGSAEMAKDMMTKLAKFTLETPFEMTQVVQGAKSLMAYGIEAEKIIPTFKTLGDIAAGVGMDKLPNLVLAFGQVKAATRLTGMELRQFTEAGVPLLDILSQQLGKTVAEVKDMVSAGTVGFSDVEQALTSLTAEGGKFNDLMLKQSTTMAGLISNIKDRIAQTMSEIVGVSVATGEIREGSLFAVLKNAAEKLYAALDVLTPKLIEFSNWLAQNQTAIAVIAGGIGGLLVGAIVAFVAAFSTASLIVAGFVAVGAILAGWIMLIKQQFENASKVFTETWLPAIESAKIAIIGFFEYVGNVIQFFVAIWLLQWAIIKDIVLIVVNWFWSWAGPTINNFLSWIKDLIASWVNYWQQAFNSIKQIVQAVVNWFMTYVYPTISTVFGWLSQKVNWLKDEFGKAFDWIKDKVDSVISFIRNLIDNFKPKISIGLELPNIEAAWNNLKERARNIGVPGFQTGGVVPGPIGAPVMATVHGGEVVSPVGRTGGQSNGGGTVFNVYVGMYAGTETEKRNIAADLYAALAQVAQSQNKNVQELMGA